MLNDIVFEYNNKEIAEIKDNRIVQYLINQKEDGFIKELKEDDIKITATAKNRVEFNVMCNGFYIRCKNITLLKRNYKDNEFFSTIFCDKNQIEIAELNNLSDYNNFSISIEKI